MYGLYSRAASNQERLMMARVKKNIILTSLGLKFQEEVFQVIQPVVYPQKSKCQDIMPNLPHNIHQICVQIL